MLSVEAAALTDHAAAVARSDDGASDQQWRLIDQRDGSVMIKNRNSGGLLTARSGKLVQDRSLSPEAQWQVPDHRDGQVTIGSAAHGGLLGVDDSGKLVLSRRSASTHSLWQLAPKTQVKLQNRHSNKVLAAPLMTNLLRADAGAQASASYTHPGDDVNGPLTNTTGAATPRWTCWNSKNLTDWYAVTLSRATTFNSLRMNFYDDKGGVRPPLSYTVQVRISGSWTDIVHETAYPETPAPGYTTVRFDSVLADAVRVTFTNRNPVDFGTYIGLLGFELYDTSSIAGHAAMQVADNGSADQLWEFDDAGNGHYRLTNVGTSLFLSIQNGSPEPGTPVVLATSADAANSQWMLRYVAGGYFAVVNAGSGQPIAIAGDSLTSGAPATQGATRQASAAWSVGTSGT